jgi:excisionase family DNA binding protein
VTRRSLADVPDDFAGCARPCWGRELNHTYAWGSCEKASEPPREDPVIGYWRVFDAVDGHDSIAMARIPFRVVFPWARNLPLDERYQMMDELAEAEDAEKALKAWQATAETWADPMALDVLTRERDPQDYVDAPRPQDEMITTGQIAEILGVTRPTAVRILDTGKIPSIQANVARKARKADVLAYRDRVTRPASHDICDG